MASILNRPMMAALVLVVGVFSAGHLVGCDDAPKREGERAVIGGETFYLETALDDPTRFRGLTGRSEIAPDGGMVFVFPRPHVLQFVMRDCLVEIDIAFLDDAGRVLATYTMATEPRNEGESDRAYEARLTKYSSRFQSRVAIELAAGTYDRLGVKVGDVIDLDLDGLKEQAR